MLIAEPNAYLLELPVADNSLFNESEGEIGLGLDAATGIPGQVWAGLSSLVMRLWFRTAYLDSGPIGEWEV